MAGHMGDERVTQRGLRVAEVDAERNLLLVAGAVPGLGRRRGRDQERRLMAALLRTQSLGRRGRQARRRRVRPRAKRRARARGGDGRAGRPPPGHALDQDPRPGGRRPRQAVAPEGHRPRPPGHDPRPAVDRRRRRVRPAPAQLQRQDQPQGARQGAADRALGARAPTAAWRGRRAPSSTSRRRRRAVELRRRLAHASARWWSSSGAARTRSRRSFRNLERTHVVETGDARGRRAGLGALADRVQGGAGACSRAVSAE